MIRDNNAHFFSEDQSMDVSEEDIDCFMEHVGHHRNIDKNIYACPPAMRVMQTVTPILEKIDGVSLF